MNKETVAWLLISSECRASKLVYRIVAACCLISETMRGSSKIPQGTKRNINDIELPVSKQ
jgi:hypothetical protein